MEVMLVSSQSQWKMTDLQSMVWLLKVLPKHDCLEKYFLRGEVSARSTFNSTSVVNDELFKGYRGGNLGRKINEIAAAYDLLNTDANNFNVSIWYNATYKNDSGNNPLGLVRVPRSLNVFGTPWADGTASISQCAINAEETFVYRFKVDRPGTYFYHGHYGMQRSAGLYGSLIVEVADGEKEPFHYISVSGDWYSILSVIVNFEHLHIILHFYFWSHSCSQITSCFIFILFFFQNFIWLPNFECIQAPESKFMIITPGLLSTDILTFMRKIVTSGLSF